MENEIKITHLSDVHSKKSNNLVNKVKQTQPDIIVITGDLINDKGKNIDNIMNLLVELNKIAQVYYITGNHERRLECFEELMLKIKETKTIVLRDEFAQVNVNSNNINILGLDEKQGSFEAYKDRKSGVFQYKNYSRIFEEYYKMSGFKIVLSHFPENFEGIGECSYNQYDFDLMLSGHAHGGQFILPFVGPVFSPGQGLFPKYARGRFGDRPTMIVSRGIGNSEFPFRLFNYPEIISITVKGK